MIVSVPRSCRWLKRKYLFLVVWGCSLHVANLEVFQLHLAVCSVVWLEKLSFGGRRDIWMVSSTVSSFCRSLWIFLLLFYSSWKNCFQSMITYLFGSVDGSSRMEYGQWLCIVYSTCCNPSVLWCKPVLSNGHTITCSNFLYKGNKWNGRNHFHHTNIKTKYTVKSLGTMMTLLHQPLLWLHTQG